MKLTKKMFGNVPIRSPDKDRDVIEKIKTNLEINKNCNLLNIIRAYYSF